MKSQKPKGQNTQGRFESANTAAIAQCVVITSNDIYSGNHIGPLVVAMVGVSSNYK